MKLKLVFTVFLLVGTIQQSSAETPAAQSSPEALVSDLYKQKHSPFFQTKNHGLVDKYFSEGLAQLIWKDAVSSKGEVGALDFDPRYDAQDIDIKKFWLQKSKFGKDEAEVVASFENMGHKTEITYSLVPTKMGWKISNIKYADGRNLVGLLSGK
jgi:myo-inositol-1-phosphate synthase